MRLRIAGLVGHLLSQGRALENAREASTARAPQAVEREEVRLFLEARAARAAEAHTA
jgi:hypothetical protein